MLLLLLPFLYFFAACFTFCCDIKQLLWKVNFHEIVFCYFCIIVLCLIHICIYRVNKIKITGRHLISSNESGKIKIFDIYTDKIEEFSLKMPLKDFKIRYDTRAPKPKLIVFGSDEKNIQLFICSPNSSLLEPMKRISVVSLLFTHLIQQANYRVCDKDELFFLFGKMKRVGSAAIPFLIYKDFIYYLELYVNTCKSSQSRSTIGIDKIWNNLKRKAVTFIEVGSLVKTSNEYVNNYVPTQLFDSIKLNLETKSLSDICEVLFIYLFICYLNVR